MNGPSLEILKVVQIDQSRKVENEFIISHKTFFSEEESHHFFFTQTNPNLKIIILYFYSINNTLFENLLHKTHKIHKQTTMHQLTTNYLYLKTLF